MVMVRRRIAPLWVSILSTRRFFFQPPSKALRYTGEIRCFNPLNEAVLFSTTSYPGDKWVKDKMFQSSQRGGSFFNSSMSWNSTLPRSCFNPLNEAVLFSTTNRTWWSTRKLGGFNPLNEAVLFQPSDDVPVYDDGNVVSILSTRRFFFQLRVEIVGTGKSQSFNPLHKAVLFSTVPYVNVSSTT